MAKRTQGAALLPDSLRPLTFDGKKDITIAPGDTVVTDLVALPVAAGEDLAGRICIELAGRARGITA